MLQAEYLLFCLFLSFIYLYAFVHVDILSPMIVVLSCLLLIVFVLVPT